MSEPDFQPTLVGPTIIVRPVSPDDWAELYEAGSDPKIWEVHPVPNRYAEPEFRKFFDGGAANREVKRLMLDHAFTFVDTVVFWVGKENWRSQGAMKKIGRIKRDGLFARPISGTHPYVIFDITGDHYHNEGRAIVA